MSHFSDVEILCHSYNNITTADYVYSTLRQRFKDYSSFKYSFMLDDVNREFFSLDTTKTILASIKDSFNNSNNTYHVFLESDFTCINNTISYEFLINKFVSSGWIGLGAGNMELINKNRPNWKYGQTDHGSYIVADNGWVGAYQNPTLNNRLLSFKFKQDDIIRVTYDKNTKNLKFEKNPGKDYDTYTIPNVPPTARPCVVLLFIDETITLRRA